MTFAAQICIPLLLTITLGAQEVDTILTKTKKATSILDEVEDPAERKAYLALRAATDPLSRRSLATTFLHRYPGSWLLAQVYEAAAKSSMELSDDPSALSYARRSLQIYPENPLLLVPVAIVQARRGETRAAIESARTALEYLDRFAKPAGIAARDWKKIAGQLRESATQILNSAGQKYTSPGAASRANASGSSYAGSLACKTCHIDQFVSWSQTGMARMLRPVDAESVIGDFETKYIVAGGTAAQMSRHKALFFMDLRRTSGGWDRYRVDFTIGSKWQQAYATRMPSGELHVLPIQYNKLRKSWINYWSTIDPHGSERSETGEFYRARDVTSYQQNCAPCHTSQPNASSFREPGVNCEMCHGPSAAHASGNPAPWSFRNLDHKSYVDVCAQCHAQSALREPQMFPPRYERRPYVEFSRRAFYRDGRFRETTFIVEAFERSSCFRKGKAHCGSCHDPHPPNPSENQKSLRFLNDPDQMCLQCHDGSFTAIKHTHHEPKTEGSRCTSCHMPRIMNSLLFLAGNHQIDDKPNAAMTAQFGQTESPNACLQCHGNRSAQWLTEQLRSW
ncbi:MAG: hypothetical protein H7Y20_13310 [Bryobacteraceae bacterium]|nr:hypothetical protein [Bryobacteraceae bacterium]